MCEHWSKFRLLIWKNWILQYRKPIQTVIEILAPVLFSILLVIIRNLVEPTDNNTLIFDPFSPTDSIKSDATSFICDLDDNSKRLPMNIGNFRYTMGLWNKFSLLMWKNTKAKQRNRAELIGDLISPLINVALILILKSYHGTMDHEQMTYDSVRVNEVLPDTLFHRAYSPSDNLFLNKMMTSKYPDIIGQPNSTELENFLMESEKDKFSIWIGIQFDDDFPEELTSFSGNITITLRYGNNWHIQSVFPDLEIKYGPRYGKLSEIYDPPYMDYYFCAVMYNLTHDIIDEMEIETDLPKHMYLKRFPYPQYEQDSLIEHLGRSSNFGMLFMGSLVFACCIIVKSILSEKENHLKESLMIMGVPIWLHRVAWFLQYFLIHLLLVICMTLTFTLGNILKYTNWSLVLILHILYILGLITFSFTLGFFINQVNIYHFISQSVWVLTLIPYVMIRAGNYSIIGASVKYFSSLIITSGLSYALDIICLYETKKKGVQWDNIFETSAENNISFGGIIVMMTLDVFIYLFIGLYLEQIYPRKFGVPQKWYFIFNKEFWCGAKTLDGSIMNEKSFGEEPTSRLKVGIRIKKLSKYFGPNEVVKDLTLNLYEDQITVLVGHNGAGKTTTMSMLTGLFPPSKGTAIINGYDIRTQIMNVRDSMGLCLQHNVLFDDLTVKEHLKFFSKLKGTRESAIEAEVYSSLKLLNLEDQADEKSSKLSGGMKRRLSIGIAFCGNPKVVILDEPTSGMDPTARRFIWKFLRSQKKGRTILLTTHFMDEADSVGDRIAIMSNGELKCCGSSFFLKKKYGTGYRLTIDKLSNCEPKKVTHVLEEYIPHIKILKNAGTKLTYLLPEDRSYEFPEMLLTLEYNLDFLGIRSFGISSSDLEEVFMKVGNNQSDNNVQALGNDRSEEYTNVTIISASTLESGIQLYTNQACAMLSKKFLVTMRNWRAELLKIMLSLSFIIVLAFAETYEFSIEIQDARAFTLEDYYQPVTIVQKSTTNLEQNYLNLLKNYNQTYEITDNITTSMLELIKNKPFAAKYQYIVGASFDEGDGPIAWVNDQPYHSVPLSLQLLLNSYLEKTAIQMNFMNFPLPDEGLKQEIEENSLFTSDANLLALSVAVAFIGSFYIIFNIKERRSGTKHLQFVSGINVFIFWSVSFLIDLGTFLIAIIFTTVSLAILKPRGISTSLEISVAGVLFFSYALAALPMMYVLSFLFDGPSTGYSTLLCIGLSLGFPALTIVTILEENGFFLVNEVRRLLRMVPHYDFVEAINQMTQRTQCYDLFNDCEEGLSRSECQALKCRESPHSYCCTPDYFSFDEDGILLHVMRILCMAVIFFFILFFIDLGTFTNLKFKIVRRRKQCQPQEDMDEDVRKERSYVHSTLLNELKSQNTFVLKDLMKNYRKFSAVNGVNLAVKKFECFGLLGVNGAGKTTIFKMITGEKMITFGDVWINGYNIRNRMKTVHKFIGYCPQFDALLDNLTARETLNIFSLIRGVPRDECDYTAEKLAQDFDFTQYLDMIVKELSGGNRRKLSTSIALIGDAPVILLDEPTAGMDPASKRRLWNELIKRRENGMSIILTSSSMEECEAVCTRLAIMVKGNFQCLGSIEHLKSRFAKGLSLTLKIRKRRNNRTLNHVDITAIEKFIKNKFPHSTLKEKHEEQLNYYIQDPNMKWSRLFAVMEEAKKKLDIGDYSVGEANLDQVFSRFAKLPTLKEIEKDEEEKSCFKFWKNKNKRSKLKKPLPSGVFRYVDETT